MGLARVEAHDLEAGKTAGTRKSHVGLSTEEDITQIHLSLYTRT